MAFTERRKANPSARWNGTERRKGGGQRARPAPVDPAAEEAYWSQNYLREPYYERGYTYEDYHPGYRTGWEGRGRYQGSTFDEVERDLEFDYARNRGRSRLEWDKSRHAARAAWERLEEPQ